MPGMYQAGDFDLAGFAVGAMERGSAPARPTCAEGDVLLGLAAMVCIPTAIRWCANWLRCQVLIGLMTARLQRGLWVRLCLAPTRLYVKPRCRQSIWAGCMLWLISLAVA